MMIVVMTMMMTMMMMMMMLPEKGGEPLDVAVAAQPVPIQTELAQPAQGDQHVNGGGGDVQHGGGGDQQHDSGGDPHVLEMVKMMMTDLSREEMAEGRACKRLCWMLNTCKECGLHEEAGKK